MADHQIQTPFEVRHNCIVMAQNMQPEGKPFSLEDTFLIAAKLYNFINGDFANIPELSDKIQIVDKKKTPGSTTIEFTGEGINISAPKISVKSNKVIKLKSNEVDIDDITLDNYQEYLEQIDKQVESIKQVINEKIEKQKLQEEEELDRLRTSAGIKTKLNEHRFTKKPDVPDMTPDILKSEEDKNLDKDLEWLKTVSGVDNQVPDTRDSYQKMHDKEIKTIKELTKNAFGQTPKEVVDEMKVFFHGKKMPKEIVIETVEKNEDETSTAQLKGIIVNPQTQEMETIYYDNNSLEERIIDTTKKMNEILDKKDEEFHKKFDLGKSVNVEDISANGPNLIPIKTYLAKIKSSKFNYSILGNILTDENQLAYSREYINEFLGYALYQSDGLGKNVLFVCSRETYKHHQMKLMNFTSFYGPNIDVNINDTTTIFTFVDNIKLTLTNDIGSKLVADPLMDANDIVIMTNMQQQDKDIGKNYKGRLFIIG